MDRILAEISAGELIDKITILEIKKEKISNKEKLIEVDKELVSLNETLKKSINDESKISDLIKSDKFDKMIFSIIIGGAIGNLYDRITFNAVPDFIDLHYGSFHWFTFNVADIFITLGIVAFFIRGFFFREN